jgi:hypothetical protein
VIIVQQQCNNRVTSEKEESQTNDDGSRKGREIGKAGQTRPDSVTTV